MATMQDTLVEMAPLKDVQFSSAELAEGVIMEKIK